MAIIVFCWLTVISMEVASLDGCMETDMASAVPSLAIPHGGTPAKLQQQSHSSKSCEHMTGQRLFQSHVLPGKDMWVVHTAEVLLVSVAMAP